MIERGKVPTCYLKFDRLEKESTYAAKSGRTILINPNPGDFAKIEAAAREKTNTLKYSISAEM